MKKFNLLFLVLFLSYASYGIGPITGDTVLCVGTSGAVSDTTGGGTWSCSDLSVAEVISSLGLIIAVAPGTATITYTLSSGSYVTAEVIVLPAPPGISGPTSMCLGDVVTLSDSSSGGTWVSSAVTIAPVGATTGVVTGLSVGTAIITYTLVSGCRVSRVVAVDPLPAVITGPTSMCIGGPITLSDGTSGGIWTSSVHAVAVVGSVSGVVTGVSPGTTVVSYTLGSGCATSAVVLVNPIPGGITGPTSVCVGSAITLAGVSGGTWTSAVPAVAVVGSVSGVVTGVSVGTTIITYTLVGTCYNTTAITVEPGPVAITGPSSVCSSTITLSDGSFGGSWSSSNTAVAAVGSTGIVAGVSPGTANITYALSTGCLTTKMITVGPSITVYAVTGGGSYCAGGAGVGIGLPNSSPGITYQLYDGGTMVATMMGTGSAISFGSETAAGVYTVEASGSGGCTATMSGSATVAINPLPNAYTITGGGSYCSGGIGADISLSGSDFGVTYQLVQGGAFVGSPLAGTGGPLDFGAYTAPDIYTIVATNTSTGCSNTMSGSAAITVVSLPAVYTVTGGGGYCAGGAGVPVYLSGSQTGVSYQLYVGTIPMGAPLPGTGGALDFGLIVGAGEYQVFASNTTTSCTDHMSDSVTITVEPLPTAYSIIGGGGYCAGGTSGVDIELSSSSIGVTYTLWAGGTAIASMTGTGDTLDFGMETMAGTFTVTETDSVTGCGSSGMGSAVIDVFPLPLAYTVIGGGSYCSGGSGVDLELSGSQTGINYQLYCSGVAVGLPVAGTGAMLDFGSHTAVGVYTVEAANAATGCSDTMAGSASITVSPLPIVYTITGGGTYCAGSGGLPVGLSSSNTGISYALYDGSTLVSTLPGTGSSLDFGLMTGSGSYHIVATNSVTGCNSATSTTTIAVVPLPVAYTVTGGGSYCAGGSGADITLSSSDPGVEYKLYEGSVLVDSVTGTGSSLDFGLHTAGTYTIIGSADTSGCSVTMTDSAVVTADPVVTPTLYASVSPSDTVCAGTTVVFTAVSTYGGTSPVYTWIKNSAIISSGSSTTESDVASYGDVYSVIMNSDYPCRLYDSVSFSIPLDVIAIPTVTATAASAGCGGDIALTATGAATYMWSPSTWLSCATCAITDLTPTAPTTYTVIGTNGGICSGSATIYEGNNRIYGSVSFSSTTPDTLDMKVWLIQFNSSDSSIEALDSTLTCLYSGMPYYEFDDVASGNYLVKGMLLYGNPPDSSGYVPTYGASSAYWYAATNIAHAAGADIMDINMIYGTVPSGPGFIGGYISSGAGRGTSGSVPAAGMIVYLEDASNNVLSHTFTDNTGAYSFSNLAYGNYIIYPENFDDYTTASSVITLSPSNPSVNNIDFIQYTNSRTIIPTSTNVVKTITTNESLSVYPNPTTGALNIQWSNQELGNANVIITDVLGREVINSIININSVSGQSVVDVSNLKEGIYLLTITSDHIYYNSKIEIQR